MQVGIGVCIGISMGKGQDQMDLLQMNLMEAMQQRHAVRAYTDQPVDDSICQSLQSSIDDLNARSGLHMQMVCGVDDAFLGLPTHYGRFTGVHNAIALIGKPGVDTVGTVNDGAADAGAVDRATIDVASQSPAVNGGSTRSTQGWDKSNAQDIAATDPAEIALQEAVGYYGELVVLHALQLGLATSWAVLDNAHAVHNPWWQAQTDEQVIWFIAFGYPARVLTRRRTKPIEELCQLPQGMSIEDAPQWFLQGMHAAMVAPTSLGQQPFMFTLHADGTVSAQATEGLFAHVGLGCAVCHFEIASGVTPTTALNV